MKPTNYKKSVPMGSGNSGIKVSGTPSQAKSVGTVDSSKRGNATSSKVPKQYKGQ